MMKSGILWLTGLIVLLFVFCVFQFRALEKRLLSAMEQEVRFAQVKPAAARLAPTAAAQTNAQDEALQKMLLELQNFMRDTRGRQTALERKLADVQDQVNNQREALASDLKSFMEDLQKERNEFSNQVDRLTSQAGDQESPATKEIKERLIKIEDRMDTLIKLNEDANKRRDYILKEETEGVKIQGNVSGPGGDVRSKMY